MRRKRPLGLFLFVLFIILIASSFVFLKNYLTKIEPRIFTSPFLKSLSLPFFPQNQTFDEDEILKQKILFELEGKPGKYGIFIKNLATNDGAAILPDEVFEAASLYKLYVLAAVYEEIEEGKLSKDDLLEISEENASFDDGTLAVLGWGVSDQRKVSDLLLYMITISDNTSALTLAKYLSWPKIEEEARGWGFYKTTFGVPPQTTPGDIGGFLEKLAKKELVSQKTSEEMVEILASQRINDRLPRLLPENIKVAHKTGELDTVRHDAGIVYGSNTTYVIVVMSQDVADVFQAHDTIAQISKVVYDHFN